MSDFLALLPRELRDTIYEYALLRSEVYPYEYGSFVHREINTGEKSGEAASVSEHDAQTIPGNGCTGGYLTRLLKSGMPPTVNARLDPPSTALLRTCKQLHLEATAMVYMGNTFVFLRPESLERFYKNAPRYLFNAITDVRIDSWLLTPRVAPALMSFTREIIRILGSMQGVKHLQIMFRSFRPITELSRFVRAHLLLNIDEIWHWSSGVDASAIHTYLTDGKNEVLFDYCHLGDFECDGYCGRARRSRRGHGTVKLVTNGSETLEWEQACAQLLKD